MTAGTAQLHATVDWTRVLRTLSSAPRRPELAELVGQGGGSGYRALLQALVPGEMAAGSLLYFLLDDMPGVTVVGPFAWRLWPEAMAGMVRQRPQHRPPRNMVDICSGFRSDGDPIHRMLGFEDPQHNLVPAHDLAQPDDPLAWHAGLHATVDPHSLRLTGLRVLPFGTCPAAARNVDLLLGEPMRGLRHRVLELVVGTDGCTHLNDALRALAEVPVLVAELTAAGTDGHQAGTA